ncbi:MAG: hypothetical protein AMK73_01950 [Planctomycetes bacterium SM23_32]|nr:MAG: hypothetical protein AMK73_01950 [Planctomycetes bacterium SM23_32]
MRGPLRTWAAFVPFLAVVLAVSCTVPAAPRESAARAGGGPRAATSKLSPANASFDLEKEGLKLLWPQELGQLTSNRRLRDIYSVEDLVVIEAGDGEVHCLDASTGIWKGTVVLTGALDRPPARLGSQVLFVVHNFIFAYDLATDSLSKPYNPLVALSQAPVVQHGDVFLLGGNGHVVKVLRDGSQELLVSLDAPIREEPVFAGGRLYASAWGDQVVALEPGSGSELWRWEPGRPSELTSGVAVSGETVFVGDDRGFVYALGTSAAEPLGKIMLGAPVVGRPRVVGPNLLVLTSKPSLVCMATADRGILWRYEGAEQLLTVGSRAAYVLTAGRSVAAVALEDGKELWSEPLPRGCKVKGDPDRPVLYLADTAGSIAALAELDWYPPKPK